MQKKKPLERDIKKEIKALLTRLGIFHYTAVSTGIYDPSTGTWRCGLSPGVPDIAGIIKEDRFGNKGRALYIEIKRDGLGLVKPAQKYFKFEIERNGGVYILAHSLQEVIDGLKDVLCKNIS